MPRNGSGGYSRYTPGTPYVAGTTIDETVVNAEMDDLGNEVANSLAKDGQTVPTANLPMGGYKHTGVGNASARNHYAAVGQAQDGSFVYGTVGGTADAITLTLSPAITAYAAGQKFTLVAGAANTGAATINVNSLGAKAIKRDVSVALQAGDIANGGVAVVEYDGTNFQLLNPRTAVTQTAGDNSTKPASTAYADAAANATKRVDVRQCVLAAAIDSSGFANWISAGSGFSVNIAATTKNVVLTAAYGDGSGGPVDRVGVISADTTIGSLTPSSTCYLYADIAADGSVTLGHTVLAPVYQWGGTYSTSSGQFTFNIQEMTAKVGNGSSAVQTYRVFIGEAVTDGSGVTSVVNYAIRARYRSAATSIALNTSYDFSHKIGVAEVEVKAYLRQSSSYKWAVLRSSAAQEGGENRGVIYGLKDRNTAVMEVANDRINNNVSAGIISSNKTFYDISANGITSGEVMVMAERDW